MSGQGQLRTFLRADMLRHAWGFKLANDGEDTRSLQAYLGLIPETRLPVPRAPPSVDRDVVQWYIHAAAHAFGREVKPGIAIQVAGEGLFDQAGPETPPLGR
jgi:hypothetical protein